MINDTIEKLNFYGKAKTPILFIIDFDIKKSIIIPIDQINDNEILFKIKNFTNCSENIKNLNKEAQFKKYPLTINKYKIAFKKVKNEFILGNTVLLNLTFPTKIETNLTLREIFYNSIAKYKLLYQDYFVVFSPEQFIEIKDNIISTYPMKGTIDAAIPDAKNKILNDEKEFAEHITIVDLLRNDLGMISKNVTVEKFRYVDEVITLDKKLLQISSKIRGKLDKNWHERVGDILISLLPAGSVTGAPKKKSVEIIKKVENYERGYYTGIFGYFDGEVLDSAVMIRFIEKDNNELFFKSGGGITIYSDLKKEYNELIDKVYLPFTS